MYEPRIADKITVDLRCGDCPDGARCARCQAIVDAAVAETLAAGVSPEHIHVKGGWRGTCAQCGRRNATAEHIAWCDWTP
jgi:bacterioferritin-associated ferredoxin